VSLHCGVPSISLCGVMLVCVSCVLDVAMSSDMFKFVLVMPLSVFVCGSPHLC
jgi:hypothetical protein